MNKFNKLLVLCLMLMFVQAACNIGKSGMEVPATEVPLTGISQPVTEVAVEPSVQHEMTPGELPSERFGTAGDYDSSPTADEHRAPAGDRFTFGRYERPFNSDSMDEYYPYLDIQDTSFYMDETWMYAVITLKDDGSSHDLVGNYGVEFDLNVDGGGDYLILVNHPTATDWTTDGVQVWFDENKDVGGELKQLTDKTPPGGDGFEKQIFGDGQEEDHDLAWVRVSPTDPNIVQVAAKASMLQGDTSFLVGMWAGADSLNPANFDFNDRETHEQAGTSLIELNYFYPVKDLSKLDNSCEMAIGFQATGNEPGLCPLPGNQFEPGEPDGPCPPPQQLVCSQPGNTTAYVPPICRCANP